MLINARLAMWLCIAFSVVALGAALTGFSEAASLTDEAEREASLGYAWFWASFGVAMGVLGVLSWMLSEGKFGPAE